VSSAEAPAIARLEAQVSHLLDASRRRDEIIERMADKIDRMEAKLDQSAGGIAVLRWFGFGSLASALAASAAVFAWLKS